MLPNICRDCMGNKERGTCYCEEAAAEPAGEAAWPGKTGELMEFLRDNAQSEEATRLVEEIVGPLVRRLGDIVEAEREWPLADRVDDARLVGLAADVAALTGRPATRCVAVSLARPFPKPAWMTNGSYQEAVRSGLRAGLGARLWAGLGARLWASLGDSLGASLRAGLGDSLGDSLPVSLRASLWISLFYCLGFALVGDRDRTERLVRVMEAYAEGIIPFGFNSDDPDVLLILKD